MFCNFRKLSHSFSIYRQFPLLYCFYSIYCIFIFVNIVFLFCSYFVVILHFFVCFLYILHIIITSFASKLLFQKYLIQNILFLLLYRTYISTSRLIHIVYFLSSKTLIIFIANRIFGIKKQPNFKNQAAGKNIIIQVMTLPEKI